MDQRFLFEKVGVEFPPIEWPAYEIARHVEDTLNRLKADNDEALARVVEDLLENRQYYRNHVNPRYRFDTPLDDLRRLLPLDGWQLQGGRLVRVDQNPVDLQAEENSVFRLLRESGLPNIPLIEAHLNRSAEEYGVDNNNSLTNSRQAFEQLLRDTADVTAAARGDAAPADENVRQYLHNCGFFNQEEWRGFNGVYGFVSAAAHPGIADPEVARFGRNFVLGACHYALQKLPRWVATGYQGF